MHYLLNTYHFLKKKVWHIFYDKCNDWNYISFEEYLSEDFIREFSDRVEWYWISLRQNLSEGFIREFSDKVDWKNISLYQSLSKEFIAENLDKLHVPYLLKNNKISNETKEYVKMLM